MRAAVRSTGVLDVLWSCTDLLCILVDRPNQVLDGVDLSFFEVRLPALLANPSGHRVQNNVTSVTVHMDRRRPPRQLALTVNTFHEDLRCLNPSAHSPGSGR